MKKILAFAMSALFVFSLAACSSSSSTSAKNGTYTAEMDDAYVEEFGYGYRDTLTVVYEDGVIVSATFDSVDIETGTSKADAEYPMDPSPSVWIPELSEQIVVGGNSDSIDGIAGATNASENARKLLAAIETEGVEGGTVVVAA